MYWRNRAGLFHNIDHCHKVHIFIYLFFTFFYYIYAFWYKLFLLHSLIFRDFALLRSYGMGIPTYYGYQEPIKYQLFCLRVSHMPQVESFPHPPGNLWFWWQINTHKNIFPFVGHRLWTHSAGKYRHTECVVRVHIVEWYRIGH